MSTDGYKDKENMRYTYTHIHTHVYTHTHTHTHTQCFSAIKNEILPFITWLDLEGMMLSEVS